MTPGDYNLNGAVDAADYTVWRDGLGTTYTQADYDVWRANFGQTIGSRAFPDKYDLLMDVATEEFSHLEIVGATITMLLAGVNGELKDAAEGNLVAQIGNGSAKKNDVIGLAMDNPRFLLESAGGPLVTDSLGVPWTGAFVNANSDLSVDLRSNIGAETRAKIIYERLLQFTDDPYVQDSLKFLMTREIAHFQQFSAALATIEPNFPPGVLQGDPRFTHAYFNMSNGEEDHRGPWNKGKGPWEKGEQWEYIEDPTAQVLETAGQSQKGIEGHERDPKNLKALEKELAAQRRNEVTLAGEGELAWNSHALAEAN